MCYKVTHQGEFCDGNRHKSFPELVTACFQWESLLKTLQKDMVSQEKSKTWLRLAFISFTHFCLSYSHTDSVKKQVESHKRAAAANASGKLKDEIVPVATKVETRSSKLPFFG